MDGGADAGYAPPRSAAQPPLLLLTEVYRAGDQSEAEAGTLAASSRQAGGSKAGEWVTRALAGRAAERQAGVLGAAAPLKQLQCKGLGGRQWEKPPSGGIVVVDLEWFCCGRAGRGGAPGARRQVALSSSLLQTRGICLSELAIGLGHVNPHQRRQQASELGPVAAAKVRQRLGVAVAVAGRRARRAARKAQRGAASRAGGFQRRRAPSPLLSRTFGCSLSPTRRAALSAFLSAQGNTSGHASCACRRAEEQGRGRVQIAGRGASPARALHEPYRSPTAAVAQRAAEALTWRKKMSTAPSPVPLSFFSSARSCAATGGASAGEQGGDGCRWGAWPPGACCSQIPAPRAPAPRCWQPPRAGATGLHGTGPALQRRFPLENLLPCPLRE